jgi:hypothetical protein
VFGLQPIIMSPENLKPIASAADLHSSHPLLIGENPMGHVVDELDESFKLYSPKIHI